MRFKAPFTAVLAAPSCSGKTTWVLKLLRFLPEIVDGDIHHIVWCYGEEGAIPPEVASDDNIRKFEGVPTEDSGILVPKTLILVDDLMHEAYNETISKVYTRISHHREVSMILISQNVLFQSPHARNISLSTKYFILLRNCRERSQFAYLARQIYPENPKSLCEALFDAWSEPFGYLVVDVNPQQSSDAVRFRRNIWPSDPYTIVYANRASIGKLQSGGADCPCVQMTAKDLH